MDGATRPVWHYSTYYPQRIEPMEFVHENLNGAAFVKARIPRHRHRYPGEDFRGDVGALGRVGEHPREDVGVGVVEFFHAAKYREVGASPGRSRSWTCGRPCVRRRDWSARRSRCAAGPYSSSSPHPPSPASPPPPSPPQHSASMDSASLDSPSPTCPSPASLSPPRLAWGRRQTSSLVTSSRTLLRVK